MHGAIDPSTSSGLFFISAGPGRTWSYIYTHAASRPCHIHQTTTNNPTSALSLSLSLSRRTPGHVPPSSSPPVGQTATDRLDHGVQSVQWSEEPG